jgi:hypothetical protein
LDAEHQADFVDFLGVESVPHMLRSCSDQRFNARPSGCLDACALLLDFLGILLVDVHEVVIGIPLRAG